MAIFIDPRSGERYENVPDDQAERAQSEFGLVPEEAYAQQQRGEAAGPLVAGARGLVSTIAASGLAAQSALGIEPTPYAQEQAKKLFSETAESRAGQPVASMLGAAIPSIAVGAATAGVGAGLPAAAGVIGGEAAFSGLTQEATDAAVEQREFSARQAAENALLEVAFGGLAYGGGRLISAAFGNASKPAAVRQTLRSGRSSLERAAEAAATSRVTRAAAAEGEELVESLTDPEVARELFSSLRRQADAALTEADSALDALKSPKIARNSTAQRAALDDLATAFEKTDPLVARELERLRSATNPRGRFSGLQALRAEAIEGSELQAALDKTLARGDLWGDGALAQLSDLEAARALRPPVDAPAQAWREYADQIRRLPGLEGKAAALEELAERADQVKLASTLRPRKSVGAAGDGRELISTDEVQEFIKRDEDIVDAMRLAAGGDDGPGAFQRFNDEFRAAMNNRVKHEDFAASAPRDPQVIDALQVERTQVADELHAVTRVLGERGAKKQVSLLNTHIRQLRTVPIERVPAVMDRLKQTLDNLHMKAVTDKTDPYGEVLSAVDPVVERIRRALENPDYVGPKIAELQQVRNAAWSDPATGFIRNIQRARQAGADFFSRIDVDYATGDLVLEFNPRAFRSFLDLDVHDAKPGMQAWTNILDSVERMTANKLEVGVPSAAKLSTDLPESVAELRSIFETQAKRVYVKNLRKGSDDVLSRAESVPIVGKVVTGAKALAGEENVSAAAAAARQAFMPIKRQTAAEAKALLKKLGGAGLGAAAVFAAMGEHEAKAAEETVQLARDIQEAAQVDQRTTARLLVRPEQAAKLSRMRGRPASALERFQGDHDSPYQAFVAARDLVESFRKQPMALLELLAEEFGDLADSSPELHRQVATQALRISQFLQAKMPGRRNVSVAYPNGTPASPLEIRQFALFFTAATDPDSVKADARAGKLRREQVQTLKELWPAEYDGLRNSVLEEIGKGKTTTVTRQKMNLLFEFGNSVDPALGPRVSALVAAAREKQAKTQPPSSPGITRSSLSSKQNLTPGGMSALQIGPSLDN